MSGNLHEPVLLFDVDGTLTLPRSLIERTFRDWFLQNIGRFSLVSGSDVYKLRSQVGGEFLDRAEYVFCCAGNEVWKNGEVIHRSDWKPPEELLEELEHILSVSRYPYRIGRHIEIRTGMVNFSVVGRLADSNARRHYVRYDRKYDERRKLVDRLSGKFPELTFELGGEISVDIYPRGKDKAQVLDYFRPGQEIWFFCDKGRPGGNDYSLCLRLEREKRGKVFHVNGPDETWEILRLRR